MSQGGVHFQYGQQQYVSNHQTYTFDVNMHCPNCPPVVRGMLESLKAHGVTEFRVSEYSDKTAVVTMDTNKITPEQVAAHISTYTEASIKKPEYPKLW